MAVGSILRTALSLSLIGSPIWASACDGGEPLQRPPVVSEGSDRRGIENLEVKLAAGVDETEIWLGPAMERWDDLLSLTIMVRGRPDSRLSLGVEDGQGRRLVDAAAPETSPNRVLSGWGLVMAQLPASAFALPLTPPYRVTVRRLAGGLPEEAVLVRVWTKHARTPGSVPLAQELLVQVINAGGVVGNERLLAALDHARQIWRQGGIEILEDERTSLDHHVQPEVAHLVVDPALGSDSPAVKKLLELSSLALGQGLPLFLVDDIVLADAAGTHGELWALAGGVPVPPQEGSARSGIALSAAALNRDAALAGQILAHEIGHALGLYHSTEAPVRPRGSSPITLHDGLTDTPECPARADANGDATLSAAECQAFDARNLMFWGVPRGAVQISASQADVARRSMLAR